MVAPSPPSHPLFPHPMTIFAFSNSPFPFVLLASSTYLSSSSFSSHPALLYKKYYYYCSPPTPLFIAHTVFSFTFYCYSCCLHRSPLLVPLPQWTSQNNYALLFPPDLPPLHCCSMEYFVRQLQSASSFAYKSKLIACCSSNSFLSIAPLINPSGFYVFLLSSILNSEHRGLSGSLDCDLWTRMRLLINIHGWSVCGLLAIAMVGSLLG